MATYEEYKKQGYTDEQITNAVGKKYGTDSNQYAETVAKTAITNPVTPSVDNTYRADIGTPKPIETNYSSTADFAKPHITQTNYQTTEDFNKTPTQTTTPQDTTMPATPVTQESTTHNISTTGTQQPTTQTPVVNAEAKPITTTTATTKTPEQIQAEKTARQNEIMANLNEGYKNDDSVKTAISNGDYETFKQRYGYDQKPEEEKKILDGFFQAYQPKDEGTFYNRLLQGVETFSPVVKESSLYKNAKTRYDNFTKYSSYDVNQFRSAMSEGNILPGTQTYNDLIKDPSIKSRIETAQKFNSLEGKVVDPVKVGEEKTKEVLNSPIGKALEDGYISGTELNTLTNTPAAIEKAKDVETKLNKVNALKVEIDNLQQNIEDSLTGSGAISSGDNAEYRKQLREKMQKFQIATLDYNTALGTYTQMKSDNLTLFNTNLGLYQKQQEAQQALAKEQRDRANVILDRDATFSNQVKMLGIQNELAKAKTIYDEQIKNGDIYSTDPYIQQKGIENALTKIYDPLLKAGITLRTSIPAHAQAIMEMVKNGMNPAQAIDREFTAPLMSKPEVDAYKASISNKQSMEQEKAQAELAQTKAQTAKLEQDVKSGETSWTKIGVDENGQDIYGFVNKNTQQIVQAPTNVTFSGMDTDLRNSQYVSQYPNEASFKNNNPAGITWNASFKNGTGVAKALTDAGINYSIGTARPKSEGGNYVQFDTIGDGMKARQVVFGTTYGNTKLSEALQSWKEGKNRNSGTQQYANTILSEAGIPSGKTFNELTQEQKDALTMAQIKRESRGLYNVLSSTKPATETTTSPTTQEYPSYIKYVESGALPSGMKEGSIKAKEFQKKAEQGYTDAKNQQLGESGFAISNPQAYSSTSKKQKEDIATAIQNVQPFLDSMDRLKALVTQYGTENPYSEAGKQMKAEARNAQLMAKEIYNLGVLNGPDLELMQSIIADPTTLEAGTIGKFQDYPTFIESGKQKILSNMKAKAQSAGIQYVGPKSQPQNQSSQPQSTTGKQQNIKDIVNTFQW